ncbi:MAG: hypothetical protein IJU40_06670 [Desulfovibrionaceae bacterium]|nr:hypothetical protein [Desulfovibrionaceae bacterium]
MDNFMLDIFIKSFIRPFGSEDVSNFWQDKLEILKIRELNNLIDKNKLLKIDLSFVQEMVDSDNKGIDSFIDSNIKNVCKNNSTLENFFKSFNSEILADKVNDLNDNFYQKNLD